MDPQLEWSFGDCTARRISIASVDALQRLHESCSDFVELISGRQPEPGDAEKLLHELPPGKQAEDKLDIGLFAAGGAEMIGFIDLIRDYPLQREWFLGLLLLDPAWRGSGLGATVYRTVEGWIREQKGRAVHLVVQVQNSRARQFWERLGFLFVEYRRQKMGTIENTVALMTKVLD